MCRRPGTDAEDIDLLFIQHLAVIPVKAVHSPLFPEILQSLLVKVCGGDQLDPFVGAIGTGVRSDKPALGIAVKKAGDPAAADNSS